MLHSVRAPFSATVLSGYRWIAVFAIAFPACSSSYSNTSAVDASTAHANDVVIITIPADAALASSTVVIPPDELVIADENGPAGQSPGYREMIDANERIDGQDTRVLIAPGNATTSTWAATTATHPIDQNMWGKRFRMRAKIRTSEATSGFAWFRIDSPGSYILDNMALPVNRTLRGTTDWMEVELVLDVPRNAVQFAFGSGLIGRGFIWIGPVTIEEVDDSIPTTPHFAG